MKDEIKTNRLYLRQVKSSDLADLFEYASQKQVAVAAGFNCCQTLNATKTFLADLAVPGTWVLETIASKKVIGNICLFTASDESGEPDATKKLLGYALNQLYWNQGYMTEALGGIVNLAKQKNIAEIEAVVSLDNSASQRVLEKNRFEPQMVFNSPVGADLQLQPVVNYRRLI
ncbi:MAG: GNAT family N-acetyltransferase [Liquorilactobacillus ghanensis]|uniref:GNAT family N-acetyltransferase n=1 Tax=Liquorilactobacillus ghanensis TaxID=399370 RepID=UPI0039E79F5F